MTTPTRRVERAVRVTPRSDRTRYETEWRSDLAAAESLGVDARDVGRGAMALAVQLRIGQLGRILTGRSGVGPALVLWGSLGVLLVAAFWFGGPVLVVGLAALLALVVILLRTGTPSHWSHWLMVVSIALGVAAFGYVWWSVAASVAASDDFRPEPAAATWTDIGLVVMLLAAVGVIISAVVASRRERRTRG